MAQENRTTLKTYFETGDTPTEAEFIDLIDSSINVNEDVTNGTSKATPVDADKLSLWDSVSSSLKTLSWANLKATLKTYFDMIYAPIGGGGGTEFQIYEDDFFIDSGSLSNWIANAGSSTISFEYFLNTGRGHSGSMLGASASQLRGYKPIGVAEAAQTVEFIEIYCNMGLSSNFDKVTVIKASFTDATTLSSIVELYRGDVDFSDTPYVNLIRINALSFANISIDSGDILWIFFASSTTANITPCRFRLKCSID